MKHTTLDYHFICEQVQYGALRVAHVSLENQLVDALIKPLPQAWFLHLKTKIGLSSWSSILWGIIEKIK